MSGMIVCLSAAVLGVDYGWQPVAGGGIEYIIQIEPELLDSLKAGHDLFSDLPAAVRNIRSYRITVGTGRLPHHGEPPPANVPAGAAKQGARDARAEGQHPADVDLTQLPGPVLGPALVRPASPANTIDEEEEPSHLVASESKPIGNRVAGYHAKAESPAVKGGNFHEEPARESPEKKVAAKANERADVAREAEKPNASHHPTTEEPESPSDRALEQPQAAAGKAMLVQLALYASLCSNAFLLWVATGQRSRYRALVRRMFDGTPGNVAAPPRVASNHPTPRWEQLPSPDESDAANSADKAAD